MGAKLKKVHGAWYLYVNYQGRRKCKKIGFDRKLAEEVRRQIEAKLALGDLGIFGPTVAEPTTPTFGEYADQWLREYARIECKESTVEGYEGVLKNYLRPRFAAVRLPDITRGQVKAMIADLMEAGLSRGTIQNALSVIRKMYNEAIEAGLVTANPAGRLGRFTRGAASSEKKGVALTPAEVQQFLDAVKEVCPEYYPLFFTAVRAGLRRGELVALQFGDLNFGADEEDPNRYIFVQHNYVRRKHTSTKSKKTRRVDMSKELRAILIEVRDKALLAAYMAGRADISSDLVFPGPDGGILDPDNLYHRLFIPAMTKAGIRKIRLHDLRHTFGSLLVQRGAPLPYVKEQMGHYSIQVTVDIYGHLVPGADVRYVDQLDAPAPNAPRPTPNTTPQTDANQTQTRRSEADDMPGEVVDLLGGGGWTRTSDLRIMRPSL